MKCQKKSKYKPKTLLYEAHLSLKSAGKSKSIKVQVYSKLVLNGTNIA